MATHANPHTEAWPKPATVEHHYNSSDSKPDRTTTLHRLLPNQAGVDFGHDSTTVQHYGKPNKTKIIKLMGKMQGYEKEFADPAAVEGWDTLGHPQLVKEVGTICGEVQKAAKE